MPCSRLPRNAWRMLRRKEMIRKFACSSLNADKTRWGNASIAYKIIDSFNAKLMQDQKYMKHQSEEEGGKRLTDLCDPVAERVVEAQRTHFEAFEMTIKQYTSRLERMLNGFKRELVSAVNGPVVLTDGLKELFAGLEKMAVRVVRLKLAQPMGPR